MSPSPAPVRPANATSPDETKPHQTDAPPASLWRNRPFLTFWFGESISLFGTQITMLALPLTAVLVLNAGPQEVGLLRFSQMLPFLVFGLLFGVLVDRVRRRPLMIAANLSRMLLVGLVPLLAVVHLLDVGLLLVIAFLIGVGATLFDVSWMSFVPTIIGDRRQLVEANSKLFTSSRAADTAGPAIGGVLVTLLTAPVAMVANAVTFALSTVSLLLIRSPEPAPQPAGEKRHLLRELGEGVRYVAKNRLLRDIAMIGGFNNFIMISNQTLFIVYTAQVLKMSPGTIGFLLAMGGSGGLVGAVISAPLARRFPLGPLFGVAISVAFVAPLLIPAAAGPTPLFYGMFVASFLFGYAAMSINNVVIMSVRQSITPNHLMGRMNSVMRTVLFGMGAIGGPIAGLLGAVLGVHEALWICAVASVLALVPALSSKLVRVRELRSDGQVAMH